MRWRLLALLLLAPLLVGSRWLSQGPFPDPFTSPPVPLATLTVNKLGSGTGTVTGTGIDCGSDCTHTFTRGVQITLTATASGGGTFSGWSGACTGTGSCIVTMSAAQSVTATFTGATPADRFASPTGLTTGDCLTVGTACTVQRMLAVIQPGEIGSLADGTYQGDAGMIQPPAGKSGTQANPITIRASSDGQALLDGQFARETIRLDSGNDWWVFEGFNAKNSRFGHFYTPTGSGSDNNVVRRVVVWDIPIDVNADIVGVHGGTSWLFEDFAAFGTGRKVMSNSQGGDSITCRRCWFRWEGTTFGSPVGVSMIYNTTGTVYENVLVTWSGESMPETYTNVSPVQAMTNFEPFAPVGILSVDRLEAATTPKHANAVLRASIAYTKATDKMPSTASGGVPGGTPPGVLFFGLSSVTLTDVVRVMDPTHSRFNQHLGIALVRRPHNCAGFSAAESAGPCEDPVVNNTATRLTSIRGTHVWGANTGDSFGTNNVSGRVNETDWTVTNVSAGASLAAVQSPWQNTSTSGARLCYRTVNGTVDTGTPLWPWPMNDRIKAATAAAGAYAGPCTTNCVGGRFARTQTDVTADIEALLGTIPAACRTAPPFPDAPSFPATGQVDGFDGTGTLTGWTTISGSGFQRVNGAAVPISGFSTARHNTAHGPNQEAWGFVSALPNSIGTFIDFLTVDDNNRYIVSARPVTGSSNDTLLLQRVVSGVATTLIPDTNLGVDMAIGDGIGAKVSGNTVTVYYRSVSWNTWKLIGTFEITTPTPPASSFIGMGFGNGGLGGMDSFGGGTIGVATLPYFNSSETNCFPGNSAGVVLCEDFETANARPSPYNAKWGVYAGTVIGDISCYSPGGTLNDAFNNCSKGWGMEFIPALSGAVQCGAGVTPFGQCAGDFQSLPGSNSGGDHGLYPNFAGYSTLFIRWYTKFSSNYVFGAEKMATANNNGPNGVGIKWGNFSVNCAAGSASSTGNWTMGFVVPQDQCVGVNVGGSFVAQAGHWYAIQNKYVLNTPKSTCVATGGGGWSSDCFADGEFYAWIDDCGTSGTSCTGTPTLRMSYTGIKYQRTTASDLITFVWFEDFSNPSSSGIRIIDNIKVGTSGPIPHTVP